MVLCKCGRKFKKITEWREHEMILRPSQSRQYQERFPEEMPRHTKNHFIVENKK
jgi:hypothetical protein